jgi:uncharacterized ion transporter superfamily protein YfcC
MKITFPHPLVIMLVFVVLATVLTYIIPAGQYDRILDKNSGREVVVPNSYHKTEAQPIGFFDMLVKIPEGVIIGADIVVLILIFGGAFYIIDKTGAIGAGIAFLIEKLNGSDTAVLVIVGLVFASLGLLCNLQEEIIALVPVLLMMTTRLGYKNITAVTLSTGCAAIGASFSPMNPFQVGIAQKIAEVPLMSGWSFRLVVLLIAVGFWIFWCIRFGKDQQPIKRVVDEMGDKLDLRKAIILTLVTAAFAYMIYGIVKLDWGFNQMTALFFAVGVIVGLIGQLGINGTSAAFVEGFKEMIFAGFIVGLARSIFLIMQEGMIIDTIVYGLFTPLQSVPVSLSAVGMMVSQAIIHVPVSSVSGQAALTIPILTPLADLIGLSRQVMVLAYQYGAGITDLVTPTNGALVAVLAAAKVSFGDWLKFAYKPILVVYLIGAIATFVGVLFGI